MMLTDFATRLARTRRLHASGSEWGRDVIRGARSRSSVVAALAAYPAHERCILAFAYAQAVRDCVRMRGGTDGVSTGKGPTRNRRLRAIARGECVCPSPESRPFRYDRECPKHGIVEKRVARAAQER